MSLRVVAVMQARTASSRLPGKALLPIAGIPSAMLASLRARNRSCEFIFATSSEPADDRLAAEAQARGLQVFRGPLNDVLARFSLATAHFVDEDVVVRLTADNVLPDGEFVEQLCAAFLSRGAEYMSSDLTSRLPYGLAAEIFSVKALRRAHAQAVSEFDREHVGPWMKRNCAAEIFVPELPQGANFNHLRCTIDDEEDYQRMLQVFSGIDDPVKAGWFDLVRKLGVLPGEPAFRVPWKSINSATHSEMALGTAQLGMAYGRVNDSGCPSRKRAVTIVRTAITHGVTALDTARAYGDAEAVLGDALASAWNSRAEVVTKLDLSGTGERASSSEVRRSVDAALRSSCDALRTEHLGTVLLHRWQDHDAWHGAAWERVYELQAEGLVNRIGVSVYEPEEAWQALEDERIQHIQVPVNILDRRWRRAGVDRAIAQRTGLIVHARSAFLQGILLRQANRWPQVPGFDNEHCVRHIAEIARLFGRESVADLCVSYLRSLPWITSIVVGCETLQQLEANLGLFLLPRVTESQIEEIEAKFPDAPDQLLNPSLWDRTPQPVAYVS